MVTVSDATSIISRELVKPAIRRFALQEASGGVLAEAVVADRDFPPFNRVSMDGIAIVYAEWSRGRRSFRIDGTQAAGEKQKRLADPAHCMEVMTGAVLPTGCDTVVRYEDLEIRDGVAELRTEVVTQWQSIHLQGIDARKGQVIIQPGQVLAPSEIALLASVGKTKVELFAFPRIAIISTGDELVDIDDTPADWQIRRSNSYAIQSALRQMGVDSHCFHLEDEPSAMERSLATILEQFDVLILSGGVSKGKFDFVPGVLERLGVMKLFHQVSQRPGKPFWFGRSEGGKIAFALPGNPVSTFLCFYRYVRPWILKSLGVSVRDAYAVLGKDFTFAPALTCFLQVTLNNVDGRLTAHPVPGGGSGDFANLQKVDGFLELPLEKTEFKAGEVYPCFIFRE